MTADPRRTRSTRLAFERLESRLVLSSGPLVISEFLAVNGDFLDEDEDTPDWIEIHNPAEDAVELEGWYLTDDADNLTRWRFPQGMDPLGAGEYLVVFASGKDRSEAAGELHTDFRLRSSGEYLALVQPDGETVAYEFAPEFPEQFWNISYGPTADATAFSIPASKELTHLVPGPADAALGTSWAEPDFDDSAWSGFTESSEILITEASTGSDDWFEIQNVSGKMVNTSGWVVAVNNATNEINTVHDTLWELPSSMTADEVLYRTDDDDDAENYFGEGINWKTFGSGWLIILDDQGQIADSVVWGYDDAQLATMSISVRGVEITAADVWTGDSVSKIEDRDDTLQRSGVADHGNLSDWAAASPESMGLPNAALVPPFSTHIATGFGFDVDPSGTGNAVQVDVEAEMHNVNSTLWVRIPFEIDSAPSDLDMMNLRMKYNDGFVAYVNGQEVARRNAPQSPQWDSAATAARDVAESLAYEEIDISESLDALLLGTNVLAVQGLNVDAADGNLLILPDLLASGKRYFATPTPGEPNGEGFIPYGAVITNVTENPPPPQSNEDLTVTAKVTATLNSVDLVRLHYRVDFRGEVTLPMVDDGVGTDVVADDGVFAAVIPSSAYNRNDMVRWYVTATDVTGQDSREPIFLDPKTSQQYFGTVVQDPSLDTELPVFQYFVENVSAAGNRTGTRTSVFYLGEFYDNVYVRLRGGYSTQGRKFEFNPPNATPRHDFLFDPDLPRVDEFNLNDKGHAIGGQPDEYSYMRQVLAWETYDNAGAPGSLSFPMHVRRNGSYLDVRIFVEQPDADMLRRNGLDPEGALYKMYNQLTSATSGVEKKPPSSDRSNSDLAQLVAAVNPGNPNRERDLFDLVDIPATINYIAATSIMNENDHVQKNYYVYRDTYGTGEWMFLPWDKDLTFGRSWNISGVVGNRDPFSHPLFGDSDHQKIDNLWNRLIDAIHDTPVTREMYLRRLRTLMDELLQPPGTPYAELKFEQRIDELEAALEGDVGSAVFRSTVDGIRNDYLPERREHLYVTHGPDGTGLVPDAQPDNFELEFGQVEFAPSSGNQDEAFIELTNPNDYAVDISGWQLSNAVTHTFKPGTVIPANRSLYVSPNALAFRARAAGPSGGQSRYVQGNYRGHLSSWGETIRLLDADGTEVNNLSYPADPSQQQRFLRVSEVMYNPPLPTPGEVDAGLRDKNDFEFIELTNIGSAPLNLAGASFVGGVDYTFDNVTLDAGQRVVLVANREAFELRYGSDLSVAGQFTAGRLSNAGEQLKLNDASNGTIHLLDYQDAAPWPGRADGKGASLEIIDPAGDAADRDNWRSGSEFGGTPGTEGVGPIDDVVVNEVLTRTPAPMLDAIELHNTTDQPVDVGGWYLSDDWRSFYDDDSVEFYFHYNKFRIPNGTTIEPHGYLVFDERDFNAYGGADPETSSNEFALDGTGGDDVWLVKADAAGNLTHFVDHVEFGAAAARESFGRWPDAQGDMAPMAAVTLGGENSGPRVGPVIISELHYNPSDYPNDTDLEFIELFNPTSETIDLTEWRLRKGIDFDFAADSELPAGTALVVLPFDLHDPADADAWSAFCTAYGLDENDPSGFVGGYSGSLSNGGERVQLQRPDGPVAIEGDFIPRLLEDEVDYQDAAPWPLEADGGGMSLTRLDATFWGNDPNSWTAADPTPGVADLTVATSATVAVRYVFYNNSAFDRSDLGLTDDDAIAPDKEALLPGATATFANYTSYVRGINGLMIDVADLAGTPTAGDFEFRVGNGGDPGTWAAAAAPQSIAVRVGAGSGGSDRVTIVWADNAVAGQWLQVRMRATAATGLADDDVFYFGNAVGEAGNSSLDAAVNTTDEVVARNFQHGPTNLAAIDDPYDYNRDKLVNTTDRTIARNNQTGPVDALRLIAAPAGEAARAQAAEQESANAETSSEGLAWLAEFEQMCTASQPTDKDKSAHEAVLVFADRCGK